MKTDNLSLLKIIGIACDVLCEVEPSGVASITSKRSLLLYLKSLFPGE